MSNDAHDSVEQKVLAIFTELAGERTGQFGGAAGEQMRNRMSTALAGDYSPDRAHEIAFHLVDWVSDAAFIMAVHLFPERFTNEELVAGADMLLIHAPNHLAAAAKLAGHPIQDIFDVGVCDDTDHDA